MLAAFKLILPALIPSWRFFKSVQPSPRVEWRAAGGQWRAFRPRPDRVSVLQMIRRLVWNPGWNEALYAVSLAERLMVDPVAHAEDELFRLIAARAALEPWQKVQFRLIFVTREASEVMYQSGLRVLADIR